jgi:N-succinyldiaminopimelate aminotransferase
LEGRGLADGKLTPPQMNPVFADLPVTVFEVMSRLAREHGAVNLGQGFPDDPGPEDVRRKAAEAVVDGWNQYPPMMGLPELREAIAAHYRHWQGLTFDPDREVMVTSGATEAIAGCLFALIEPGDEVVLFQPLYDAYLPLVRRAGGIPRFVRLEPPHWRFSEETLARAFSPRTKVVLFNNPLNPAGTVFAREDLELLARFCERFEAIAVCDEVWEHVVFDGRRHGPLIAVPGMRERCVKIGSAGKIFSLTGWKVGLVCAAPDLMRVLAKAHQFLTFTTPPNLQAAVAYGLAKADGYFTTMRRDFQRSRDRFADGLRVLGFPVLECQGTYFLNIDLKPLGLNEDDENFCRRLVAEHKVAAIPMSAFYADDPIRSVVRFCFAKRDQTLDSALERLAGVLERMS